MNRFLIILVIITMAALGGPTVVQWGVEAFPEQAEPVQATHKPTRRGGHGKVVLSAGSNGHFATTARINNRFVDVMVDTGATSVALPYEEAARLGVRPASSDFVVATRTANGIQHSAAVTLREVRIDTIRLYDVEALVAPRGALSTTLLGMSFLSRLKQVEMGNGELVMRQ